MAPSKGTRSAAPSKKSKLSTLTLDSLSSGPYHRSSSTPSSSTLSTQASKASRPLTSFAKPPLLRSKGSSRSAHDSKGKAPAPFTGEDQLWVDKYIPETEAELAVHKKKVEDVRRWLTEAFDGGPTGVLKKYRRILSLTGPAGTGKTAVLQVLARELDFEIVEWRNSMEDNFSGDDYDRDSLAEKFETFLTRASSCRPLSEPSSSSASSSPRRVILLEDIPNVLHSGTAQAFHDALEDYIASTPDVPVVVILSDAGTRGTDSEGDTMGSRRWGKQVIDVRSVIPPVIFNSPYFTEIQFNPIAPTLLVKALTNLLARHFSSTFSKSSTAAQQPSKEIVQMIVDSAHGDIRSAIMALQFACVVKLPKGKKKGEASVILEAVTRREQSLAMFHMLGKVLYNKRKGDPQNSSASAKDRAREEALDSKISDPPDLPLHLEEHTRRGSRVDVNTLYADSPIDTSLFALYLHHNYTQFCNEVDECDAICEWLSWIDASGGESWQAQQNPHQFHILALGTLHGLPSPVPRRSQKMFKPEFFDVLKRSRAAEESIADTEAWLNTAINSEMEGGRRWGRGEVVLEMGGVLKALDACGADRPPSTHGLFTTLSFVHPSRMPSNSQRMQQLGEAEGLGESLPIPTDEIIGSAHTWKGLDSDPHKHSGGWLENDDIQDF